MKPYGIHWFRRDLRVAGNTALEANWKEQQGRTVGLFFLDRQFLSRADFSENRFCFFLETLQALKEELIELGSDLYVMDQPPHLGIPELLTLLTQMPACLTLNRDYEPFARHRDASIQKILDQAHIPLKTFRDHLILEPHEVLKPSHDFYQVYTPFSKKWTEIFLQETIQQRVQQTKAIHYLHQRGLRKKIQPFFCLQWKSLLKKLPEDALETFLSKYRKRCRIKLPPAGSLQAYQQALQFIPHCHQYLEQRDFPAIAGTSRLSPYLKNGSWTTALWITVLREKNIPLPQSAQELKQKSGPLQFLKELIWREFYYHILYHCPYVENQAFLPQYRQMNWPSREDWFEAWKEGQTGYPIVDAGMRELKATGWMHNRVRMVVASFLTKDLLIDWRWGEKYFMQQLLDGDLAPNNGGWQWAASTGCDPQPYFRIFNPSLQSQKFDPEGSYLKKWIPELKKVPSDKIHQPGYRPLLVEHAQQKEKAMGLFKSSTSLKK